MTTIEVAADVAASPDAVWQELAALEHHSEWMADAERIVFRTAQRRGVGTAMEVLTRVGPLRTLDLLVVDRWDEGRAIGVAHQGLMTGSGVFTIEGTASGSRIIWREDLVFPWYLGGGLTARLARPILRRIWRGNLARLAERVT